MLILLFTTDNGIVQNHAYCYSNSSNALKVTWGVYFYHDLCQFYGVWHDIIVT
jgi:hypothetical protein